MKILKGIFTVLFTLMITWSYIACFTIIIIILWTAFNFKKIQ